MAHIRAKGFVLRDQPIGDADRLISLLTSQYGLITAAARGARRSRSPLLASTQVFALSDFELFHHRGRYTVDSAELIEPFLGLHQDIYKMICAAHLAEVFIDGLRDDLPDRASYELWGWSTSELNHSDDPLLTVHTAQLRLLSQTGLKPPLDHCGFCGTNLNGSVLFSYATASVSCLSSKCQSNLKGRRIHLSGGTAACIRHITQAPLPKLFSFTVIEDVRNQLIEFSENWLVEQMEKKYTRLDMLKDLE